MIMEKDKETNKEINQSEQSHPSQKSAVQTMVGFKNTEVGVIPSDWELCSLGEIGSFKNGINKGKEDFGHGSPFVNLLDVFGKNYIDSSIELGLINSNDFERQLYSLKKGDVIFVRSSVKPSGVGLTILCKEDLPNAVFSGFLIRFRDNGKIDLDFKIHCFYEEGFRKRVIANSTVSANTNINQVALKALLIPLPPKPEQEAIAKVLSDTDTLIEKLEQLIAKKRNVKTATMQQLLKPKEGWEVKKLGEVAKINTGSKNNEDKVDGGEYPFFVRSATVERINSYSYDCEAILIPGDGNIGEIFHYINGKFEVHQRVYIISNFTKEVLGKYVYLWFMNYFKEHALKYTSKNTVDSLRLPTFKEFEICCPPTDEQTRIAQILSDMDSEIEALERQLAKYKLLKQGLMQVLLTGKIRLV